MHLTTQMWSNLAETTAWNDVQGLAYDVLTFVRLTLPSSYNLPSNKSQSSKTLALAHHTPQRINRRKRKKRRHEASSRHRLPESALARSTQTALEEVEAARAGAGNGRHGRQEGRQAIPLSEFVAACVLRLS